MMPPISMPGMERAEPRPMPPSKPATKAGLPKRSFRRPATMPTTPGCQPSPATRMKGALAWLRHGDGFFQDEFLDRLAFLVVQVELGGEFRRLVRLARRQQVGAQRRAPHPAAGIDARPEDKAQMIGREGRPCLCHIRQRRQAGARQGADLAQPEADKGAVDADQRHHIADRRQAPPDRETAAGRARRMPRSS